MADSNIPSLFDAEVHLPVLPYGGTSGWSGSDTSETRATTADKNGTTGKRQAATLAQLRYAREWGCTWQDLERIEGWHHGTASGALSVLHKAGLIARLAETRNGCRVYVMPEYVNGRTVEQHKPNVSRRLLEAILEELEDDLVNHRHTTALMRVRATRKALG